MEREGQQMIHVVVRPGKTATMDSSSAPPYLSVFCLLAGVPAWRLSYWMMLSGGKTQGRLTGVPAWRLSRSRAGEPPHAGLWFGTPPGARLRRWAAGRGWPLAWAFNPMVAALCLTGPQPPPAGCARANKTTTQQVRRLSGTAVLGHRLRLRLSSLLNGGQTCQLSRPGNLQTGRRRSPAARPGRAAADAGRPQQHRAQRRGLRLGACVGIQLVALPPGTDRQLHVLFKCLTLTGVLTWQHYCLGELNNDRLPRTSRRCGRRPWP
eukprot:SAG22_NODE_822_length_6994_cov_2.332560_2_plen_265_part_00